MCVSHTHLVTVETQIPVDENVLEGANDVQEQFKRSRLYLAGYLSSFSSFSALN